MWAPTRTAFGRALRIRRNEGADAGQGLVEFALVAPLLLLLLIGILDAAIAVNAYVTVSNASSEAVRYATVHPDKGTDVIRNNAVLPHSQQLDTSSSGPLGLSGTYTYGNPPSTQTWGSSSSGIVAQNPGVPYSIQMTVSYRWADATIFFGGLLTRLLGASPTFLATATSETRW